MKKILFIAFCLISSIVYGQNDIIRTNPVGNNPLNTATYNKQSVIDHNLKVRLNLSIPRGASFTINNARDTAGYVMYNTSIGRMGIYKGSGVWDTLTVNNGSLLANYYTKTQSDVRYAPIGSGVTSFNSRTGIVVPSLSDYSSFFAQTDGTGANGTWGIGVTGNAGTVTNGVYTNGSYDNPGWINELAWSKITGAPSMVNSITGTPNQVTVTGTTSPVLSIPSTFIAPGSITATNIASLGSTATTFLTHTSGLIQSRTVSQVLTDVGAVGENLLRTGKIIYVDTNNPNATDTRTGLSQYSTYKPFKTIQAGHNATVTGDILYVQPGTYNESITIGTVTTAGSNINPIIFLNNATVTATATSAFVFGGNTDAHLYLNNSIIQNTGNSLNKDNTSAIWAGVTRLNIYGNSMKNCKIISSESHGLYIFAALPISIERVSILSTNGSAISTNGSGATVLNVSYSILTSTNSDALYFCQSSNFNTCAISGGTSAINVVNQIPQYSFTNSTLNSTNGYTLTNTVMGSTNPAIYSWIYNSQLTGYSGILSHIFGGGAMAINFKFENSKLTVGNVSATSAINIPGYAIMTGVSNLTFINTNTNLILFPDVVRSSSFGQNSIFESNTNNSNNTSSYFNNKVGLGIQAPTEMLDVVGNAVISGSITGSTIKISALNTAPASATDTGVTGEIRVTAGYIYVCTATNTWVRSALVTW